MRDWKAAVRARLGLLAVDGAREAEILDELAQHVAQHHAELVADGVPDEEALRAALEPLSDRRRIARDIARADIPRDGLDTTWIVSSNPPVTALHLEWALRRQGQATSASGPATPTRR